ncbi:hypothetical protein O7627_07215 [Solwaraspora sp. WMMD1047]|uniref:hypothetical protein n=1 Tax=Solwaraspora sp. WMMD1047 TaxID=3016102 RepID=UPI002415B47D|nr:hypothetical protein [Solwaraspora sp. WMMD1047]MDG4829093.1 hypothetical protein [Solwaraspora sp. WMMD1047]
MGERGDKGGNAEPTLPLPGAGATGQFPPATDPWSGDPVFGGPAFGDALGTQTPPPDPAPPRPPAPRSAPTSPTAPYPGHPGGLTPPGGPEPVVARIGEISVTATTVRTPAGEIPLAGSTWQVADYWQSEQKTPTWAIVAAIVGFCVLTVFSLFFLLVKETIHRGTVQVTVGNGPRQYVARIPVTGQPQVQQIHQQVNYVRSLAAR